MPADRQQPEQEGCWTCGGTPPASGLPCICGGTNSHTEEVAQLRLALRAAEAQAAGLRERVAELEAILLEWQKAQPSPCVICGKPVCTNEDGCDGSELDGGGRWACSEACWDEAAARAALTEKEERRG